MHISYLAESPTRKINEDDPMQKPAALFLGLVAVMAAANSVRADNVAVETKTVRIGAVAYSPSVVTVFNGLKKYLKNNGMAADYVLYSNYDALVAALKAKEIDIAWNTPLAHAQYHVACGGKSQTLVMRDVDRGYRAVVIARTDSNVAAAKDLSKCRFVIGSYDSAESTVLPLYYLKKQSVKISDAKTVCLHGEVDFKGNPCCSPKHVLAALQKGRGDAGIIGERKWKAIQAKQKKTGKEEFRLVWTSPSFSHCVFTAPHNFDKSLGREFTRLMLAMDRKNESTSEIMRLENTEKWLPGTQDGFQDLFKAIDLTDASKK